MKKRISFILTAVCLLLCCGCAAANPGTTGSVNAEVPGVTTQPIATTTQPVATTTIPVTTTIPTPPTTQPKQSPYPADVVYQMEYHYDLGGLHGLSPGQYMYVIRKPSDCDQLPEGLPPETWKKKYDPSFYESNTLIIIACVEATGSTQHVMKGLQKVGPDAYVLTVDKQMEKYGDDALFHSLIVLEVNEQISENAEVTLEINPVKVGPWADNTEGD